MALNIVRLAWLLTFLVSSLARPSNIKTNLQLAVSLYNSNDGITNVSFSLSLAGSNNQTYADDTHPVDIDAFGVERSFSPFVLQPRLYLNVTHDLYEVDPEVPPVQRAEIMLEDDMANNSKLKITWDIAVATNPTYNSEQLAAYAYSMSEPEYLFQAFNDDTSAFRDDSDYSTYYYKGFFGLLLLSCQDYDFELYRGVNYPVPAEVNQYIRFNRFLSSSANLEIAKKYANSSTGQGTIFVIQGTKHANHIAPYSTVPSDEEYLIAQDAQFLVTSIGTMTYPDGNKATEITITSINYL